MILAVEFHEDGITKLIVWVEQWEMILELSSFFRSVACHNRVFFFLVQGLNVYSILLHDTLVMSRDAVNRIVQRMHTPINR